MFCDKNCSYQEYKVNYWPQTSWDLQQFLSVIDCGVLVSNWEGRTALQTLLAQEGIVFKFFLFYSKGLFQLLFYIYFWKGNGETWLWIIIEIKPLLKWNMKWNLVMLFKNCITVLMKYCSIYSRLFRMVIITVCFYRICHRVTGIIKHAKQK